PLPRPDSSSVLQSFRGDARVSADLHPLETSLLIIAGALLCFMPWALGTMHVWSQFISLGLAAAAFTVAIINRRYTGDLAPRGDFRLVMWPKLIRFPLFWLGLLLLAYILVQALNPAWVYMSDGKYRWIEPVAHLSWLPSGMETPFADMNAWRVLVIYSTAWLFACALWVGVTRRATVQWLFTVVAANGALLALIGILQKVTGAKYILWSLEKANTGSYFFATIIYKNHAGAYFNLVLMLCVALLYWHFSRAERRMERASPAPVFAFASVVLGLGVLLTNSRGAILLLMLFTLIAFIGFIVRCTLYRGEGRSPWTIVVLCAIFALFIGLGSYFLNTGKAFDRISKLISDGREDSSVMTRTFAREATLDMARDNLVTGWGAGSFRHYFPVYQRHYPEIYDVPWNKDAKLRWEYTHNDYVQLLAELGLIGAAIIAAMLGCGVRHLVRHRVWQRPHLMFVLLALVITAMHAWVDFQFHNPAILILWCASAALVGRWAELEARMAR
ncbi:MAG: O-antigen ligase family protein, partial [Verrucomicrobiota bacterium]